jgi:surfactin synthase thioesterase subunit
MARGRDRGVLVRLTEPAVPDVDLVLFPGAGAGPSSFNAWRGQVPDRWRLTAVCLPGRAHRLGERFATNIGDVADEVGGALAAAAGTPMVFFGHSLGALIALEVAARTPPGTLMVAACAPIDQAIEYAGMRESRLRQIVQEQVEQYGDADPQLLSDLVEMAAAILRADLAMLRGYVSPSTPVDCDIVAYFGTDDGMSVADWSRHTAGVAETVMIPGDHFFIQNAAGLVIADMAQRLPIASGERRGQPLAQ